MDGEGTAGILAWLIDLGAAVVAGVAVALCFMLLGKPLAVVPAGAGALLLSFGGLRCVRPETARFEIGPLSIPEWSALLVPDVPDLTEAEPLLLDQPVSQDDSKVVRLFPAATVPSAGELKARIDAHLTRQRGEDDSVALLSPDATAALRSALAELRRAVR